MKKIILLGSILLLVYGAGMLFGNFGLPQNCMEAAQKWELLLQRMRANPEIPQEAVDIMARNKQGFETSMRWGLDSQENKIRGCRPFVYSLDKQLERVDDMKTEDVYKYFPRP